jgi:hypothetical protein
MARKVWAVLEHGTPTQRTKCIEISSFHILFLFERFLTLYPPMSTGVDIGRLIAETKRRIEFQNFKNTFCSKLHELSIAEKNISFHRSASEILSSQSRSFWKNWIFLNKIFSTYRQWRSFGLVMWYRLTQRPASELDMFRKLYDNLAVYRK